VAYATLTRVLDDVKLVRRVPDRVGDGLRVGVHPGRPAHLCPLDAPRNCSASLHFGSDATVTVEDLYGRARSVAARNGALTLDAGTAAQYVISPVPVTEISAGPRTFPLDQPPARSEGGQCHGQRQGVATRAGQG